MIRNTIDTIAEFVTQHNRITLVVMLLATGLVLAGMGMIETGQAGEEGDGFNDTEVGQALEYIEEQYEDGDGEVNATTPVYYRAEDANALSKSAILDGLRYQQTVLENETVADALVGDGVVGAPNVVASVAATTDATSEGQSDTIKAPDAPAIETLDEQIAAIEALDEAEVNSLVAETFANPELARAFLPDSYEVGTAEAESYRMLFEFEDDGVDQTGMPTAPDEVQQVLFEESEDDDELFTLGQFAAQEWNDEILSDTLWLILPAALVLVLGALAFAYRDLVDVLIGFFGVILSVLWFFGILGWLRIPADFSMIVGPVLIVALSIDFGLHVFMRYREQRGSDEGIRAPMRRGTASVTVAFLLVTITAGIGFMSNVTSPIPEIREFGVAISLGVLSAFIIFVTVVPALKVSVDGLLERFGFDRRKTALGTTGVLKPVLSVGVDAAKRGAPVVVLVAVVVGLAGGLAYLELDRQGFQDELVDDDAWQTDLPGPFAWESQDHEYQQNLAYTNQQFQDEMEDLRTTVFLIRPEGGSVATAAALDRAIEAETAAPEYDSVFSQGGVVDVTSPVTVMEDVAQTDEAFASQYAELNPRENDLTDEEVTALFDAFYDANASDASEYIERDDGEYTSMLIQVPVEGGLDLEDRDDEMHALASDIAGGDDFDVDPVGSATLVNAELSAIADGIIEALLIALTGVLVTLGLVYGLARDSTLLGAITVVPIALVMGLVFGGMFVFDVPLTFLTAFLVAITVGLGIDYNIHISDRFAQELERGNAPLDALYRSVQGTGGALFGSALTSGAAFSTLALHPHPQFTSFGLIVVLALVMSFVVSVLVLPSMLYLWATRTDGDLETSAGRS